MKKILSIDIGGTNIKILASGQTEPRKTPSGPELSPDQMVEDVQRLSTGWEYEVISMGYPGPVLRGKPRIEPKNLGKGWVGFDYEQAFGKPVRILNDAAMQALGSYQGGKMLFLGLGTGLGSALIYDGELEPTELAHLPYKKGGTFEDYLGRRGYKWLGKKKWREAVADVVQRLMDAFEVDYVVLGGGQVDLLKELPPGARRGDNANAFLGGFRMWEECYPRVEGAKPRSGDAEP